MLPEVSPVALGIIFLLAGGISLLLLLGILRALARKKADSWTIDRGDSAVPPIIDLEEVGHSDAVLLVQSGGRVPYLNPLACELLRVRGGQPSLERIVRRVRPSEAFWGVCAAEGQADIIIDGSPLAATSYRVPYNGSQAMLVTLRKPQVASARPEYHQAMSASLELQPTLQAILAEVERQVRADLVELSIWDAEQKTLLPYRLVGSPEDDRRLEKGSPHPAFGTGYAGILVNQRKLLHIPDVDKYRQTRPLSDRQQYPYLSYLGAPLVASPGSPGPGELVGTLELASLARGNFSGEDEQILTVLAGQAAAALHNTQLYQQEQKRAQALAGLEKLVQLVSAVSSPEELYQILVDGLAPMLDVEILGFLVYDENRRVLEGQAPFHGLQPSIIEWAHIPLPPDSPAEAIWNEQQSLVIQNAPDDARLQALGLHHLAVAAGIQQLALVPLVSGGRAVGLLVAGDPLDGNPFSTEDLRLLSIVAGQAAPLIDNAALAQLSNRRARRAETLRRIASLTGSMATVEEILHYSLLDLARLVQADYAAVFMLDEDRGELRLHRASVFGASPEIAARFSRLMVEDSAFPMTVTGSQRPFHSDDLLDDVRMLPAYRPMVEALGLRSAIDVPLVVRQRGIGEVMLGSLRPSFFNPGDVLSVATAASQLAGAIERGSLASQTDESLRQRVDQLTALTRISRELNTRLDLPYLLERVFAEALNATRADCGTILLFELGEAAPVRGSHTENQQFPRVSLHVGDPPEAGLHPLERFVLQTGETSIVDDFSLSGPDPQGTRSPAHAGVLSAMVVPIAYQEQVAGLIHLHAREAGRFDFAAREIAETLAVQAAIAIGNAHRYWDQVRRTELLNRRVDTLTQLMDTAQVYQLDLPLEKALEEIAYAIQAATQFETVLVSVFDAERSVLHRVTGAGLPLQLLEELKNHPQDWDAIQQLLTPEYQIGRAYFIPYEQMPVMPPEIHTVTVLPLDNAKVNGNAWHPEDVLCMPLLNSRQQPVGLISLDAPRSGLRPDRPAVDALELFGLQTTLIIESRQALNELNRRLQQAESSGAIGSSGAKAVDIPGGQALELIERDAKRIHAGLELAGALQIQTDRLGVLKTLARQLRTSLDYEIVLVVEPGGGGPRMLLVEGEIPEGVNLDALLGQRSPLMPVLVNGQRLWLPDITSSEWAQSPLLNALEARGMLCMPVSAARGVEAVLLAVSRTPLPVHSVDEERLISLLPRQAASALQNLDLIADTRRRQDEVELLLDFSRRLGSLDSASVLKTLVETALRVVPSADAGMVSLWDASQGLLLPQAAAGYTNNALFQEITYHSGEGLPGQVFARRMPLRLDEVDFALHSRFSPENLMRYREAAGGRLPVSTLLVPVTSAQEAEPLGVLLLDNFSTAGAFTTEDQALLTSLAHQTALTLENARLYRAAEERAGQLQALTGVAAVITSSLESDALVAGLLDQLSQVLPYDTGILWLRADAPREAPGRGPAAALRQLVVRAARGYAKEEEPLGITVNAEDSMLLIEMVETSQPLCVGDVRTDPRFPSLIEPQRLSWLGVPLIASGQVIGVIALEKTEPQAYHPDHIQVATTFASQAAVALENARLYQESTRRAQELDERSQRLSLLNKLSIELSASLDPRHILEATLLGLPQAIQCDSTAGVLFATPGDATALGEAWLQAELPEAVGGLPRRLPQAPLFERLQQSLGIFNSEDWRHEPELESLEEFLEAHRARAVMAVPLASGSELLGLLFAFSSQMHRFSADEVELARTIGNQAALAIQNARLYAETTSLTRDLERRVNERTTQLAREHHRSEVLLRIITELSSSLDLVHVMNRTLGVLNEIVGADQIVALIARAGEARLETLASSGFDTPRPALGSAALPDPCSRLASWLVSSRQPVLVKDLEKEERWAPAAPAFRHHSLIGVPLLIGAEALGAVLFFHPQPGHFTSDQMELVQAAANQVAVAVNNAELYRLIRDQAEDLGNMFRKQQVETSRSRAILEAIADGVLVTDAHRKVTLFNASAEKILGLKRDVVIGKSLEFFTGLFGGAAQAWMDTIHDWSQNAQSYGRESPARTGAVFSEQITLETGRVVAVQLAPVILRSDFLGTVSIFEDITHQVEVDRLKSEFVATVSHELRTPMTSIKGYVDILLMGAAGALSQQQTQFLGVVKTNAERLTVLVNDLLDISRIEAGKVTLSLQPVDIAALAAESIHELEQRSARENKPVHFELRPQPDLPMGVGDVERVRQVLNNLLENSYQYTGAGGTVVVRMHREGAELQTDVIDNGIGIVPEAQGHVFERFYRGEHPFVLATSGTGLGLAVVQHLVAMHGGRIWLESSGIEGEGSTFSFTLPLYQPGVGNL